MALPGSETIVLGNAVFWKRSRWELTRHFAFGMGDACVELVSRVGGPRILACSMKAAATYASDWGDATIAKAELLEPVCTVAAGLTEEAVRSGAQVLWCGDFGCEPPVLQARL